jgi:hypothetical protein
MGWGTNDLLRGFHLVAGRALYRSSCRNRYRALSSKYSKIAATQVAAIRKNLDGYREKMSDLEPRVSCTWRGGSRSPKKFGFKSGSHLVNWLCLGGTLEVGKKLPRRPCIPISYNSVEPGFALGSEPGAWISGGAWGTLPNLLVPALCLRQTSGPHARRSPGPDSELFPTFA